MAKKVRRSFSQDLFIQEFGPSEGTPLIFFHGFPGSHRQSAILDKWVNEFNLRVLSIDRPGYGFSPAMKNPDLREMMKHLEKELAQRKIDKFYLLGVSGGNPSAVTAAGFFGERVLALGSICGLAPYCETPESFPKFQRRGLRLASRLPRFVLKGLLRRLMKNFKPEERMDMIVRRLGPRDQEILQIPTTREALLGSMDLARRQGAAGVLFDLITYTSPWPVNYSDIRCAHFIWHGNDDRILPVKMSSYLNQKIPHSKLKIFQNEGHYSLPIDCMKAMLTDLTSVRS